MKAENYLELLEGEDVKQSPEEYQRLVPIIRDLLNALGEDSQREGLRKTPERVARMFAELLVGYQTDIEELVNEAIFDSDYDDIVVVRDIEFYSMCEHHMLPFYGKAHVAYVPNGKIIGLSKIPRLVDMFARRLQVQERMTEQIANQLNEILKPQGVAVVVEGAHMCAMMRGVKKANASMVTRTMLGKFKADKQLRDNFLTLIRKDDSYISS